MTIEELWDKMQNNNKKLKEEIIQEIKGEMEANNKEIKDEMEANKKELKNDIHMIKDDVDSIKDDVNGIKGDIHIIKDVNLSHILTYQVETRKEMKDIKDMLEEYIQEHNVEHKKIDYRLTNLEWKNKIAN